MGWHIMTFTGKKVLVVAPDFPYPANHGGRLDIWGRIRALKQLGFKIDLVATTKDKIAPSEIEVVKQYIDNIYICERVNRIIDIFSLWPLQLRSRRSLEKIKFKDNYDFAILESQYVFPIMSNSTLHAKEYILRLHNDEVIYFQELAESVSIGWKKAYYLVESYKFKLLDPELFKHIKNIMFISKDEMEKYQKKNYEINSNFLPPPISDKHCQVPLESRKVLFIGSLFMNNNQEAIKWYINKVHPLLTDIEGYEFMIVGNSKGKCLEWLYSLVQNDKHIHIYDSPQDLTKFYEESCVFANSMLHGAGVKLKTIEAITNGLPVVSTTIGNQGTGLVDKEHIIIADEPILYADYIRELLVNDGKGKNIVKNAQKYLSEHYNQKLLLEKYFSAFMKG
jgi:glycosyltransferase involved in cell wall biosynthesis